MPDARHTRSLAATLAAASLGALLLWPPVLAAEQGFSSGKDAYRQGDFVAAERIWRDLAEQGDSEAQFYLGILYDRGSDAIEKDDKAASAWFEKAARQGHAGAQFNLGNAYMNGRGVAQSTEQAVYWWQQAADNGSPNAQFNLAIQYYQGKGVEKDWDSAVRYFNRAADNGHTKAKELIDSQQVPKLEPDQPAVAAGEDEAPVTPAQATAPDVTDPGTASSPESWLRSRHPDHFTIQLTASSSAEGVEHFVTRNKLGNDTVQIQVHNNGRLLHYVLMGSFDQREQASRHIASLPAALRAGKPWVRPFSDLQPLLEH